MKDLVSESMKAYTGPFPEIFEQGVRVGLKMAIEFLKLCSKQRPNPPKKAPESPKETSK